MLLLKYAGILTAIAFAINFLIYLSGSFVALSFSWPEAGFRIVCIVVLLLVNLLGWLFYADHSAQVKKAMEKL